VREITTSGHVDDAWATGECVKRRA
jgi:hypothetical protein